MRSDQTTSIERLRLRLLAGSRRLGESAVTPQDIENSVLPQADDLLAGLDAARQRNMDDSQSANRAFSTVATLTGTALGKLQGAAATPMSVDEILAVEAVIRADGSRPSLIMEQGWVDVRNPFARRWEDQLVTARDDILRFAAATGRIQPKGSGGADFYFGSGFYASLKQPVLLTNRHVALKALQGHGTLAGKPTLVGEGRVVSYPVADGLEVDFNGELAATSTSKANIVEIRMPVHNSSERYSIMDVAVMVLGSCGQHLPMPISVSSQPAFEKVGGLSSFCALGFPGKPHKPPGGIDWDWVDQQLFQETYGVKRLAPGLVHCSAGAVTGDAKGWVLGHDATTLGGNSGSGLFTWLDCSEAFALHFSGIDAESNFAHGFSTKAAQTLLNELALP
jgi:hypothetical protein